jgi:hypothetical protein
MSDYGGLALWPTALGDSTSRLCSPNAKATPDQRCHEVHYAMGQKVLLLTIDFQLANPSLSQVLTQVGSAVRLDGSSRIPSEY